MDTERDTGDNQEAMSSGNGSCHQTDTDFEKQFQEIQKLLNCQESKDILNAVKGNDIAIFIGNSKSGKSTLVNYAIGNELEAVKMKDFPFTVSIVKGNAKEDGPAISLESVSETSFPSVWSASKSGLEGKVVDAPGFEDNRGEAQDIANTFYIKEIIRNAKSVKFVLNVDINDIMSHNISNFTNFIDKIHRIFPETRILHGGIALVFSKGNPMYSSVDIRRFFKKNILNQAEMHVEKSLIEYFAEHTECLAFFEMPSAEGIINKADVASSTLDVIKNKITGIPRKALLNVQSGVSDKSKVFLLQAQAKFCNQGKYIELLHTIKDAFSKMAIEIYQAESIDEVEVIDEKLLRLHETVYSLVPSSGEELSLAVVIEKLSSLCDASGNQTVMDESNIVIHVQFIEFLDEVLRLNNCKIYIAKFQTTVETIKKEINEARILAASKSKKITEEEAENQKRDLTEQHNEEMRRLVEIIKEQATKNEATVKSQLEHLDVVDMICMVGKKLINKVFPGALH